MKADKKINGITVNTFETLLMTARRVLTLLSQSYGQNEFTLVELRDKNIATADALILKRSPELAIVSRSVRRKLLSALFECFADDLIMLQPHTIDSSEGIDDEEDMTENNNEMRILVEAEENNNVPLSSPHQLGLGVSCITLRISSDATEKDVQSLIESLVEGWTISPLLGLERFYTVCPPAGERIEVQQAWDITHKILEANFVEYAEPAIYQLPDEPVLDAEGESESDFQVLSSIRTWGAQDHEVKETEKSPEWSLEKTHAKEAWQAGKEGQAVLIGHIDTGYTWHPELAPNLRVDLGADTWDKDRWPEDSLDPSLLDKLRNVLPVVQAGHGTNTASVIASPVGKNGKHDGEFGITGTAPKAAIIPIRSTPSVVILRTGSQPEVAAGIMHAIRSGAQVISMSLGGPVNSAALNEAVLAALDAGVIVCAAAGNVVTRENWLTRVMYPAAIPGVVAVAGCDFHYRPWRDTCRGPQVVVTAPGTDVWRATAKLKGIGRRTITKYSTGRGSGTSYAVATVAGIAACWLNRWGGWHALRDRFNGETRRIPEAFIDCIKRHEAIPIVIPDGQPKDLKIKGYPAFNASDFGVGVIHAGNLMQVELPAATDLRIMSTLDSETQVSASHEVFYEVKRVFPAFSKHLIRQILSNELGLAENHLDVFLNKHGREFVHHLSTSERMRNRLEFLLNSSMADVVTDNMVLSSEEQLLLSEGSLRQELLLNGSNTLIADLQ